MVNNANVGANTLPQYMLNQTRQCLDLSTSTMAPGPWCLDLGTSTIVPWILVHGPWCVDHGAWTRCMDSDCLYLDTSAIVSWTLVYGPRFLDHCAWTPVSGPWFLDPHTLTYVYYCTCRLNLQPWLAERCLVEFVDELILNWNLQKHITW